MIKSDVVLSPQITRTAGTVAIALAVGALLVGPAWAVGPTTIPAQAMRTATTGPVDWNKRIDDALAATGSVESVAGALAAETSNTLAVLHAKARVAIEQGDLATALLALQKVTAQQPADVATLRQMAYIQELVSATALARQTLQTAASAGETDPAVAASITMRLAAIALDEGRTPEGLALLDKVSTGGPTAAGQAGVVAYLYGQYAAAAKCLHIAGQGKTKPDVALRLLEGNAALKSKQTDVAAAAFERAFEQAQKPADRLYAQERLVAASRQGGTLPALADRWLADPKLPVDRMLPLATVLRELNRVPELLKWWRTAAADPARQQAVLGDRFVHEVLGAAQSAGRMDDAVAVCRELLALNPDDPQWLSATLQALLAAGHVDEADALLRQRIAANASAPADVERLGRLARSLGRDTVTIEAGQKLTGFGGAEAIAGDLLQASIYQRAADEPKTVELLNLSAAAALEHPVGIGRVVSALEVAGMEKEAVDLLQKSVQRDPSEESLERLASLMLKENKNADAIPVLEQLMQTGKTTAVRAQAGNRLLETCGLTNTVPVLIDRLKARLDSNKGDNEDLSLLVDAYLRQQNFDAAVQELQSSKLLNDQTRLTRLAVLFLRNHKLLDAKLTLTKLVAVDPDDATETLERIAAVDLAANQPKEATKAIKQIEDRIGSGPTSIELMAGVLDQLGRPADAAAGYRRALALNPDDADDWLLWSTALNKADQAAQARHRLQVLCGQTTSDNVFATAVDGLLNLRASVVALRATRRDAILRAAERPHVTMLYHVISDLSDEMQDAPAVVRVTDASVSVSDEERPQRLRELMDVASQKGAIDTAVDCGRSLLALGDDFPPQLFLQLAEQLLVAGRLPEASRAIAHASENADAEMVADRAADLFEKYAYPAAALDALRPLADRRRNDAGFRLTFGRLSDIAGEHGAAFDNFLAAAKVAVRDVAADKSPLHPPQQRTLTMVNGMMIGARYTPPSPTMENFRPVLGGLLDTARTPDQRAAVLELLNSTIDPLMADPSLGEQPTKGLSALASAMRRASITFAQPEMADAVDAAIIHRWPNDAFKQEALSARVHEGLVTWAATFARANDIALGARFAAVLAPPAPTTAPATMPAGTLSVDLPVPNNGAATNLKVSVKVGTAVDAATLVLPVMIARGDIESARALLKSVPIVVQLRPPDPMAEDTTALPPAQYMVMAASALGEQDLATRWALAWLDAIPASGQRAMAPVAPQVISATWSLLDDAGRAQLLGHVETQSEGVSNGQLGAAAAVNTLQLAAMIGKTLPNARDLAARVFGTQSYDQARTICRVLAMVPVADRPALLRDALTHVEPTAQLALLTTLVAQTAEPIDDATLDVMRDAAQRLPAGQVPVWGDWCYNAAQKPALAMLAEAMLRTATADGSQYTPSVRVAAAVAYRVAGESAKADDAATKALLSLRMATPEPDPQLLRLAVAALSPEARQKMMGDVESESKAALVLQPDAVWHSLIRSLLLDAIGNRPAALTTARDGFATDPTDPATMRVLLDRLQDDGRWSEIAKMMTGHGGGSDIEFSRAKQVATRALTNLYRWREASASIGSDTLGPPPSNLAAQVANSDQVGQAASLRAMLAASYVGRYAPFPALPPNGGLRGGQTSEVGIFRRTEPPAAFDKAGNWPGAVDDLLQAVRVAADDSSYQSDLSAWVSTVLAHLATDPAVYDRIIDALQPAVAAHTLTLRERQLAVAMMQVPGRSLPASWIEELRLAALADFTGSELRALARGLGAHNDPSADPMRRWADVLAKSIGRSGFRMRDDSGLPGLVEAVDDSMSGVFATLCDNDPAAAETALRNLRAAGRINTRMLNLGAVWARCAAERGDMVAYHERLDNLFQSCAWQRIAPPTVFSLLATNIPDLSTVLPMHGSDADRRAAAGVFGDEIAALAALWPSNTDLVRHLAAAGSRANKQGERDAAEALFQQANDLADKQGAGEQQLWVADLATELGHPEVSTDLQRGLLEQRCLPAPRIASLLQTLVTTGDPNSARKLAADAATYCNVIDPAGVSKER